MSIALGFTWRAVGSVLRSEHQMEFQKVKLRFHPHYGPSVWEFLQYCLHGCSAHPPETLKQLDLFQHLLFLCKWISQLNLCTFSATKVIIVDMHGSLSIDFPLVTNTNAYLIQREKERERDNKRMRERERLV